MIRYFEAFAGIGGFRTAFERVGGCKCVSWCEIDKHAQKSYCAMFDTGGEQFYETIRTIDTDGLADFDLLVGGFPCQPFSVAGKRLGVADEREICSLSLPEFSEPSSLVPLSIEWTGKSEN